MFAKYYAYRLYCIFMFKCMGVLEANCIFFSSDGTVNGSMLYLLTKGQNVQVLTQQCWLPFSNCKCCIKSFIHKLRSRNTGFTVQLKTCKCSSSAQWFADYLSFNSFFIFHPVVSLALVFSLPLLSVSDLSVATEPQNPPGIALLPWKLMPELDSSQQSPPSRHNSHARAVLRSERSARALLIYSVWLLVDCSGLVTKLKTQVWFLV